MEEEDKYTRITLRIPKDLHSRIDAEADKTSKSLNAEIIGRLQASFEQPAREAETRELIATLNAKREEGLDRLREAQQRIKELETRLLEVDSVMRKLHKPGPRQVENVDTHDAIDLLRQEITHLRAAHATELEVLRDTLKSQQKSSATAGGASVMMAVMLRSALEMLPADLRKRHPEVRVWEACASAVVHGNAAGLMNALDQLNSRGAEDAQPSLSREPIDVTVRGKPFRLTLKADGQGYEQTPRPKPPRKGSASPAPKERADVPADIQPLYDGTGEVVIQPGRSVLNQTREQVPRGPDEEEGASHAKERYGRAKPAVKRRKP